MSLPFKELNDRVLAGKKTKESPLSSIFDISREFGCIGDILGRDFEVSDMEGNVIYKIRQKPMKLHQLNVISTELGILRRLEIEASKKKR